MIPDNHKQSRCEISQRLCCCNRLRTRSHSLQHHWDGNFSAILRWKYSEYGKYSCAFRLVWRKNHSPLWCFSLM